MKAQDTVASSTAVVPRLVNFSGSAIKDQGKRRSPAVLVQPEMEKRRSPLV
jgi:hypothetical protein